MQQSLKLSEFLELIKSTIEMSFGYDGISRYPVAKVRCNCWANKANFLHRIRLLVCNKKIKKNLPTLSLYEILFYLE